MNTDSVWKIRAGNLRQFNCVSLEDLGRKLRSDHQALPRLS